MSINELVARAVKAVVLLVRTHGLNDDTRAAVQDVYDAIEVVNDAFERDDMKKEMAAALKTALDGE